MSEIASSIEETNRQRVALGLAPLAVPSSAPAAAAPVAAAASAEDDRARVDEIRAELARRKEKRQLESKLLGQSLGESLISQTSGSARDWIERSRKLGLSEANKAKAQMEQQAKKEVEAIHADAYTSRDLAGTKIAHDFGDFEKGEQVILTLKDTRILSGVADGLNEDEDELLNQDLVDKERQKLINARRKSAKSKTSQRYDQYGEEEAELLSKYDSEEKEKAGLRLGTAGALTAAEIDLQSNSAIYQQDEARKEMNQLVYSLDDSIGGEKERKFQTDYKEVKFKKKKKTGASSAGGANGAGDMDLDLGSSATDSASASGAGFKKKSSNGGASRRTKAPTSSLLDFLPEPSLAERASELSSRQGPSARQAREEKEEAEKQATKNERYLKAIQHAEQRAAERNQLDNIQLAEEKAHALEQPLGQHVPPPPTSAPPREAFIKQTPPPPPPPPQPLVISSMFDEEEDDLLAESLARARRLAQSKHRSSNDDAKDADIAVGEQQSVEASIRALADRVKSEPGTGTATSASAASAASAAPVPTPSAAPRLPPGMSLKAPPAGLIFTNTTEFVRGLQFDATEVKVKKEGVTSIGPPPPPPPPPTSNGPTPMETDDDDKKINSNGNVTVEDGEVKSEDDGDMYKEDEDDDDGGDDGDDGGALDDVGDSALTGVAAALRHAKTRGILKDGGNGRESSTSHYGAEKYDAFGREQSMKEQFRFLSHKFHGIEAGLKKQEKRLNRVQQEAQRQQAIREQGGITEKIAERQRQTGTAHVVLDKKLNAELAQTGHVGAAAGEDGQRGKKRKESGPFAQFGHGKGGYHKRHKAQQADAAKKQATNGNINQ